MIALINQYKNILISLIVFSITLYGSSLFYNHKIDKINSEYKDYRSTVEQNILNSRMDLLTQQNKLKEEAINTNNKLKEVENENFKLYSQLESSNNSLRNAINDGSKRLYISATCPKSSNSEVGKTEITNASTMDNGETAKAVINPRDGAAIIEIVGKGDKYKSQLEACQEWVTTTIGENNK